MTDQFLWFQVTAIAVIGIHPTNVWLSQLVNFKNAIWTLEERYAIKLCFKLRKIAMRWKLDLLLWPRYQETEFPVEAVWELYTKLFAKTWRCERFVRSLSQGCREKIRKTLSWQQGDGRADQFRSRSSWCSGHLRWKLYLLLWPRDLETEFPVEASWLSPTQEGQTEQIHPQTFEDPFVYSTGMI